MRDHQQLDRPVWVSLDRLFNREGKPQVEPQRGRVVRLTGDVKGALHGWWRGSQGLWLAVVTYDVTMSDGRTQTFHRQLIPVEAIRTRSIGVRGGGPW